MLTSLGADRISGVDPSRVNFDYRTKTTPENGGDGIGIFLKKSPSFAQCASGAGKFRNSASKA